MLKHIIILIFIYSVNSFSMIHSTATINLCETLAKDIFIEINERKPFCDDLTKQFWLGIAGGPGHHNNYHHNCHYQNNSHYHSYYHNCHYINY